METPDFRPASETGTPAREGWNPGPSGRGVVKPKEHYVDVAAVATVGGGLLEEMARLAHGIAVDEGIGGSGYRASSPRAARSPHAHVIGGRRLQWPPG